MFIVPSQRFRVKFQTQHLIGKHGNASRTSDYWHCFAHVSYGTRRNWKAGLKESNFVSDFVGFILPKPRPLLTKLFLKSSILLFMMKMTRRIGVWIFLIKCGRLFMVTCLSTCLDSSFTESLGKSRYKIVVQTTVGQMRDQGVRVASRCLWDPVTDNYASCYYSNVLSSSNGNFLLYFRQHCSVLC